MSIFSYLKSHSVLAGTLVSVAVVTAIIAGRAANKAPAADVGDSNNKRIEVVDVANFRNGTSTVLADGIVEAQSQADLKSQIGAPVSALNVGIGDSVYAGQIILELENSDIRAQLDQVQGQYGSTRESTIDKIRDAYLKADDAVHTQIDPLILNNVDPRPQFYSFVLDPKAATSIREKRTDLDTAFATWKTAVQNLTTNSSDTTIQSSISQSQANLDKISTLLNDMSKAMSDAANVAVPSSLITINSMQSVITGARNSISGAKQSLSSATVGIAEAGVKGLQAQLDKTIIRSPISGRIAALPLRVGEFAAPGGLLATVVGSGGIQVKAYASGEDLTRLYTGAATMIQGSVPGIVTSVAPSVSTINRKVEIGIRVTGDSSVLVVGQNVQVRIQAKATTIAGGALVYTLPIQNVKIIPGEAYVFTVGTDSKIMKHPVTLGSIKGDFVDVTAGLVDGMKIATPVYELEEGQEVRIE